jgi:hypothetical protein
MAKIQFTPEASIAGTSFHRRTLTVNPAILLGLFPDYSPSDSYKVSREWTFTYKGYVFTLYDWKETSLYDNDLPSEYQFWNQDRVTLHIGSATPHLEDEFRTELEHILNIR